MKSEPPLDDIRPPQFPQVGDLIDVQGCKTMRLSNDLHTLVITDDLDDDHHDHLLCATQDGEKDNIIILRSEIIDWRKNP
jgi:hypothetical protein